MIKTMTSIISFDERDELEAWITRDWQWAMGGVRPPHGWRPSQKWKTPPPLFDAVGERVRIWLGIDEWQPEPRFGWTANYQPTLTWVTEHCDPEIAGFIHLRANVLVTRPPSGGMPIVGGRKLSLMQRDAWALNTAVLHSSTRSVGGPRLLCSYGFLVPSSSPAVL